MRKALPVLLALVGFGSSFSFSQVPASPKREFQSPLDSYIDSLRNHQISPAASDFAKICGVKLDVASHRFAFSNDDAGTWRIVANLPEAYDNIGMDLIGTAEVWKGSGGIVVEIWNAALDVGGFGRTFYCFDKSGRLNVQDDINFQFPDEGSPWGMHDRWALQPGRGFQAVIPFQFIDLDGNVIPRPQLDKDYSSFVASWGKVPPAVTVVGELKLPSDLFR